MGLVTMYSGVSERIAATQGIREKAEDQSCPVVAMRISRGEKDMRLWRPVRGVE